jgi:hypothetical protein
VSKANTAQPVTHSAHARAFRRDVVFLIALAFAIWLAEALPHIVISDVSIVAISSGTYKERRSLHERIVSLFE